MGVSISAQTKQGKKLLTQAVDMVGSSSVQAQTQTKLISQQAQTKKDKNCLLKTSKVELLITQDHTMKDKIVLTQTVHMLGSSPN